MKHQNSSISAGIFLTAVENDRAGAAGCWNKYFFASTYGKGSTIPLSLVAGRVTCMEMCGSFVFPSQQRNAEIASFTVMIKPD